MSGFHNLGDIEPEEFVIKAIERLRVPPYKGIHSVFSGFNEAFRQYYPLLDPVTFVNNLSKEGKIVIRPAKKGVIIYKSDDAPSGAQVQNVLKLIIED